MASASDQKNIRILAQGLNFLNDRDREFAESLLSQFESKGQLSMKQWPWVVTLGSRATLQQQPDLLSVIGPVAGVIELFQEAKKHKKYPKIRLMANRRPITLKLNGPNSSNPGDISVTNGKSWSSGLSEYYGCVSASGQWLPSGAVKDVGFMSAIQDVLIKLAGDPVGTASAFGKETGSCCFCTSDLTDERSVSVGYGPVCAKYHLLPWGPVKSKESKSA